MAPELPASRRQRLMLSIMALEQWLEKRSLTKQELQKLLFLHSENTGEQNYSFVPLTRGCYSFTAARDMEWLADKGWIKLDSENISLKPSLNLKNLLMDSKTADLKEWFNKNKLRDEKLIAYTYRYYPYYAINSIMTCDLINEELLTQRNLDNIKNSDPRNGKKNHVIFTIGYEGISIEEYLNKLIMNDVALVCDVRRNPISRKYGFSKTKFSQFLNELSIGYKHFPALGIDSEYRKNLNSPVDYKKLFQQYSQNLPSHYESIREIASLSEEHKRIAITCFEAQAEFCHRHCLSDFLEKKLKPTTCFEMEHI